MPPRRSAPTCARRRTTSDSSTSPAPASRRARGAPAPRRSRLLRAAGGRQARHRERPRVRTSAGTRASAASAPRAGSTGASRSTSVPSAKPSPIPGAPDYARLIGPNLWPEAQPELREVVSEWHDHLSGVARKLLRAWAAALGAPAIVLRRALRRALDAHQDRALPRQGGPDAAAGRRRPQGLRCAHAAVGRAGKGRPPGRSATASGSMPRPCPGAFVVNIGELLEYATQGLPHATNHRVISPKYPDDRISVPFFFNPALDARLPIIELPASSRPKRAASLRTRPTRSTRCTARTR